MRLIMEALCGRFNPELGLFVLNEWVFDDRYPDDRRYVCARSSGASDYVAEWWHIDGKYRLLWTTYHEFANARDQGTLLREVDTLSDVLLYCSTHVHPDL